MLPTRCIILGFFALLCCGFVALDVKWPPQETQRLISLRILAAGMPNGMAERIQDAAAMWTSPAVRFVLAIDQASYTGEPGAGTIALGNAEPHGRAGTQHYATQRGLSHCSIVIDLDVGPWHTGAESPPPTHFDTQTIVAHELGHCLGLGHSDQGAPPVVMRTFIHTGEWQRVLGSDDIAGRDALFPLRPPLPVVRRSGCALFGG